MSGNLPSISETMFDAAMVLSVEAKQMSASVIWVVPATYPVGFK